MGPPSIAPAASSLLLYLFHRMIKITSSLTWEKSGNEARELDNRQLHERTDRLSLFLFIPTLQFDPESLSKFGHIYVHMCPNMSS